MNFGKPLYDYGRAVEPCVFSTALFFLGNSMDEKKPKKKLNTLDKYIIFCLFFIAIYTIAHTVIFAFTGQEARVLDVLVFGAFSGEIVQCYFLKKFKLHEEAKIVYGNKKSDESVFDETAE